MAYGYDNPYYRPYQMQSVQQPVQGLVRVTGMEGARAYQMPPNSVMPLFDGDQPLFYVRTTDAGGFPTIKTYRFEEVKDQPQQQQDVMGFVREEFGKVHEEIERIWEAVNAKPAFPRRAAKPADE